MDSYKEDDIIPFDVQYPDDTERRKLLHGFILDALDKQDNIQEDEE